MNRSEDQPVEAEHRKVEKASPGDAGPGEILVDQSGNVVIAAPPATAAGDAPQPGGEE
jgi:hypothetical protein